MNLKNLFAKLSLLVVFLVVFAANTFAATYYVSATNGNDLIFPGTQAQPFQTIGKALTVASDGDVIVIFTDTYNEGGAQLNITKAVTFQIMQTPNTTGTVVLITNGIKINSTTGTKTVTFQSPAGFSYNLGTTATALDLTAGTMENSAATVVIGSGATITRSGGSLTAALTTTNVNVTYNGTADMVAGPELPSSLGNGVLTVNMAATKTLTVNSNVTLAGNQLLATGTGTVNFNGVVTFSGVPTSPSIHNQAAGTVTFANAVVFTHTSAQATLIQNQVGGTITLTGGIATTNYTVGLNNVAAGKIKVGAGTYAGPVNNNGGGTIELLASATFSNATVSNNNAASVIKLNSNQLTLSNAGGTLTNAGKIISTTAATVGNGIVLVSGVFLANGGGELPNVTITGKLTLGANTTLYGNFILNSAAAGAFTDGGFNLSVAGNFSRIDNTVGNYAATGTLTFVGTTNQSFNPGQSLTLNNLEVNNTGASGNNIVTMSASVVVAGTGGAWNAKITAGRLDLSDYNLTLTGAAAIFDNGAGASYYTSTGNGYLILQGNGQTIQGAGVYGNMLVNTQAAPNTVSLGSSPIKFSGILVLYKGALTVGGGQTFQLTADNIAIPSIRVKTDGVGSLVNGGTVNTAAGVVYNLEYFGAGTVAAGGEWIPASINNLWVNTTGAQTITGPASATTIAGTLTVNAGQTLNQSGQTYTLSGNSKSHNVPGSVTTGTLNITGTGSTLTGSSVAADAATVNNLTIAVGAAGTFTSTNLKAINNLTNTSGTSVVTMNSTTAGIVGNLTLTAGSLTLTMGSTAAQQVVVGTSTLTAGTLTLGSNIYVTGATTQAAGNIDAGGFKYTQLGSGASPDYNRTGAGTFTNGTLVLDATLAAIDITNFTAPVTSFTVPNLELIAAPFGITLNNALTVSNSLTHTSGAVNYSNITLAGPTYHYVAGTIAGTFTVTNTASTLTFDGNVTIPTFVINAPGGTVTVVNGTAGAKTITVSTAFTLTDGTLAMGINNLEITGNFTRAAGSITQSTGYLIFNNAALDFATGTGFSIDNLEIQANATNATENKQYTVNKNLLLTAGTLTNDEKLTIGDGALVTVDAGFLTSTVPANYPSYGGVYDVIYITAGAYAAGDEIPANAAVLRNLTVNNGAAAVTLTNGGTVNGTLYLKNGNFTIPAAKTLTLVSGGTWQQGLGTLTIAPTGTFTRTSYNLVYSDGFSGATTNTEFPVSATNILSLTVKDNATKINLNNSKTVNGNVTINGNAATLINFNGANTLTVKGNVTVATGNFTNQTFGTTAKLSFAGSSAQTFNVPAAGLTFPLAAAGGPVEGGAVLEINNTAGVTLAGGNLTMLDPVMAFNAGMAAADQQTSVLNLVAGTFSTGSNTLTLWHTNAGGSPVQGFTRTAGWVVGKVKKYLDATNAYYGGSATQALTRVEFPVGSATNYKPMAFQFNTLPTANFNLTVSEVEANPAGTNGFPITDGSLKLANYPGFYWLVTSDLTLQPQVKYDIEAEAYGYGPTNYPEGIQNVRFLRRFDTDVNNPWLLQGGLGYDNSTNVDHAKVIVRNAEGAISTQGARFTYSQVAQAPTVTTANAAVTVAEGSALTITWTATSKNLGGTATFEATPVWTATAPAVVPTNATFNAATGTLTWTPDYTQAGTYTVKVKAVDGTLYTENTVTITVTNTNRAPSFTATGAAKMTDQTIPYGTAKSFTYVAVDPDNETLTYSVAVDVAPAGTYSISNAFGSVGLFTFTPTFADLGKTYTFTVTATDPNAATATAVVKLTVAAAYTRGDANTNGVVDINDAIKILDYVVGKTTLTAEQMVYADCNTATGDGVVGAFDAAYVLKYIANNNSWAGVTKAGATQGAVEFSKLSSENGVVTLPLVVANAKGITSIYAEAELGQLEIGKVTSRLPEGWIVSTSTENGRVRIAAAGLSPISDGIFATIEVKVNNKETAVSVVGNAKLNDELSSSLNAKVREIPSEFALSQNYPNPFNPTTTIKFAIANDARVNLVVYDMLGQKVRTLIDNEQEAGYYSVRWDGTNDFGSKVSSGIYIYRLQAGNFVQTMKMNLMK